MKNFYETKTNETALLLRKFMLPFLLVLMTLGVALSTNAQKFEVNGNDAIKGQSTEISLSGSTFNKIYYLFRIDEAGTYHSVTFMVGQGESITYATQKEAGTYVIIEFDEFKEFPFNFELYKPEDGVLQTGKVVISDKSEN
jgi:hypothetical protein